MSPDLGALQAPLPYLLRPGAVRRRRTGGYEAQALAFLDRAVIETALDANVGVDGWQVRFTSFSEGVIHCSLGIFSGGEWRWREDVGYPETDSDKPALSASTNAFKRAAGRWGVGRFMRDLPKPWLPCKVRLKEHYPDMPPDLSPLEHPPIQRRRTPVFSAWACDPEEEMERCLASSRAGGAHRIFSIIAEHGVPMPAIAKWCLAQGCRDIRALSAGQRGQLESLIVSGHFRDGGANGGTTQT